MQARPCRDGLLVAKKGVRGAAAPTSQDGVWRTASTAGSRRRPCRRRIVDLVAWQEGREIICSGYSGYDGYGFAAASLSTTVSSRASGVAPASYEARKFRVPPRRPAILVEDRPFLPGIRSDFRGLESRYAPIFAMRDRSSVNVQNERTPWISGTKPMRTPLRFLQAPARSVRMRES
jgi:hypothetical protein